MEQPQMELEMCGNCKKEIPHCNYVMHTAHCARNITLCPVCKEPVPKAQFPEHRDKCEVKRSVMKKPSPPPAPPINLEKNDYFRRQREVEQKKIEARNERRLQKMERLVDAGEPLGHYGANKGRSGSMAENTLGKVESQMANPMATTQVNNVASQPKNKSMSTHNARATTNGGAKPKVPQSSLLPCKFCELELPKAELEEHEDYCGSRTDKCIECGEIVMFKHKDMHHITNHGLAQLNHEPKASKPIWDSMTERAGRPESPPRRRQQAFRPFHNMEEYMPSYVFGPGPVGGLSTVSSTGEKLETSREISRRLDCKTEYIRNLLHDSASITAPIRPTGAIPRYKNGTSSQNRRRNPPTELMIPCEFCNIPIPHEDLIQHETGCRPDLARFNPRRRSPSPDYASRSDEEDLPCEFCSEPIPASKLHEHQQQCYLLP